MGTNEFAENSRKNGLSRRDDVGIVPYGVEGKDVKNRMRGNSCIRFFRFLYYEPMERRL